jgi:hypothetical protein
MQMPVNVLFVCLTLTAMAAVRVRAVIVQPLQCGQEEINRRILRINLLQAQRCRAQRAASGLVRRDAWVGKKTRVP